MRRHHRIALLVASMIIAALCACDSTNSRATDPSGASGTSAPSGTKGTGEMADCGRAPNTCNGGRVKDGGTIQFAIGRPVQGWNILAAVSDSSFSDEVLTGVLPAAFAVLPDLSVHLNTDLLSSATVTTASPQTIVYRIRPGAVWNDGVPITADDFTYAWKSNNPAFCPKCGSAYTGGYTDIESVVGSDEGKTVTVVFATPFVEWQSLFAVLYPAHLARQHGDTATATGLARAYTWFDTNQPTYSGGPFQITSASKEAVVEAPNPKWYGATKSRLDKLVFRVITDQGQQVSALRNGEVQGIYTSPTADTATSIANLPDTNSFLGRSLRWEHADINERNALLADVRLRRAIYTAIDRQAIVERTIGSFVPNATTLDSHMYLPGQPGYQDNITPSRQGTGDIAKATALLTEAGYTGIGRELKNPAGTPIRFRCSYANDRPTDQQVCLIISMQLAGLGITVTPTPDTKLVESLLGGKFDFAVLSWVVTPFPVYNAQSLFELSRGFVFGHNDDPAMESLLNQAATSSDPATVRRLVNEADVALTDDAYNLPLYQLPDLVAAKANIANIRRNSAQVGPPYNAVEWGLRS